MTAHKVFSAIYSIAEPDPLQGSTQRRIVKFIGSESTADESDGQPHVIERPWWRL